MRLFHFGFLAFISLVASMVRAQNNLPAFLQSIPDQTIATGTAGVTLDLRNFVAVPGVSGQVVQFDTVLGKLNVELLAEDAPLSVADFLSYVTAHSYNNTIIHRSAALNGNANHIVQGGGYDVVGDSIARMAPIVIEYKLPNIRGTLALARTSDLNSATSEWFFNVDDNSLILGQGNAGGYAVFARVLGTGMSVIDAIAALPTFSVTGTAFTNLPLRNVTSTQNTFQPANEIIVNSIVTVPIFPANTGDAAVLSFSLTNSNPAAVNAAIAGSTLTLTPVAAGTASITLTATDTNGNPTIGTFAVTVSAAVTAPVLVAQPVSRTVTAGSTVVFSAPATGATSYRWQRNGVDLAGATSATLVIPNATAANVGSYVSIATNFIGSVTSSPAALTVVATNDPGRLVNLSINTVLGTGEVMTMGTVLGGNGTSGTKPVLVRAAGPALAQLGLTGFLPDPMITLTNTSSTPGTVVASNDNWGGTPALVAAFAQVAAFPFPANSKDAAIFQQNLAATSYTVQVSDTGAGTGTVIAELYDETPSGGFNASTPRLINVSVRKPIAAGSSVTLGFFVGGTTAKTVLIRGIGPGLAQFGVTDAMPNPQLTLYNSSSQVIAANDDWGGDPQITAAGSRVAAFAIANGASKDAMLLITLAPGTSYTAQVSPVGAGGSAIVEVYEVP